MVHPERNYLNEDLIERQKVSPESVERLYELHEMKDELFQEARLLEQDSPDFKANLRALAKALQEIEFNMQHQWGFEVNADCHTHWYQMPHCKCPQLDNYERVGSGSFVHNMSCPVHDN